MSYLRYKVIILSSTLLDAKGVDAHRLRRATAGHLLDRAAGLVVWIVLLAAYASVASIMFASDLLGTNNAGLFQSCSPWRLYQDWTGAASHLTGAHRLKT